MNVYVSDLFFNHPHARRDAYFAGIKPDQHDQDAERAALLADAQEFAQTFEGATGAAYSAEELVADFYARV